MKKALLYRLFGIGKLPEEAAETLQSEGIVLADEGLKSSTTYKDFSSPGRRSNWRRVWHSSALALTETRFAAFHHTTPLIDVTLSDERFKKLRFSIEDENTLVVAHDASLFHTDWSGTLEYRFRTADAREFLRRLTLS